MPGGAVLEGIGELAIFALEAFGEIFGGLVDFGPREPRVGDSYRVKRGIDVVGRVLPTSSDPPTSFETRLTPGVVIHVVTEPRLESTTVDVRADRALIDGIIPRAHRAAAAAGYTLEIPTVLLRSNCRRITRGRPRDKA
jgi:hypothetical protein